jgi:uncharacterized protein DUF6064
VARQLRGLNEGRVGTVNLPFSSTEFFEVFGAYNRSLWPLALALWIYALAGVAVLARHRDGSRFITLMLAVQWAWGGLAYHIWFFSRINPAAWLFGALFLVESTLLVLSGVVRREWHFSPSGSPRHLASWVLIAYALMYPFIARAEGHLFPQAPTFGVPCPTTILTAGFLLAAEPAFPILLAVIPVVWAFVGGSAAFLLGVRADLMLLVAGIALIASALTHSRRAIAARV